MMYEITQDCRIGNQEAPEAEDTTKEKPAKASAKKGKKTDEVTETPEAEQTPEAEDTTKENA